MTDDGRTAPRMHPDDLAAIIARLDRRVEEPALPPRVGSGVDAQVITDSVKLLIERYVASFLTREEIRNLIADEMSKIGLRLDEDHIEETGDAIRSAMKWHKRVDKVIGGIALAVITAAVYAIANLIGIKLPTFSGGGG